MQPSPTHQSPAEIVFASESAANLLVAGVPAAVRAIMEVADTHHALEEPIRLAVPGGWSPSPVTVTEASRLVPSARWSTVDALACGQSTNSNEINPAFHGIVDLPALHRLSREIVSGTGKPTDGIVSRKLNRPISQFITRIILMLPAARPWHATLAAGLIGIVMTAALLVGGAQGLLVGAALFQIASIIDGVDGEMARATFRSSAKGAMMDSLTDMATNLGFIGGVSYNLFLGGEETAGIAGAAGGAFLALGSAILAIQSRRDGGDFTFDALKTRFRQRPSLVRRWLTYVTMRDFYAFAAFLTIMAGFADLLLFTFLAVAAGWFAVLCWTLFVASTSVRRG